MKTEGRCFPHILTVERVFLTIEEIEQLLQKEDTVMEHEQLSEAIRSTCAVKHWYGVDARGPEWRRDIAADDPRKERFEYTPATDEQLAATEAALGFPLPPVLSELYSELANGGFGPAYGLRGAIGGFSGTGTIVEQYKWTLDGMQPVELASYTDQWTESDGQRFLTLARDLWPTRLLPLCEWGCGIEICLDCIDGQILRVAPVQDGYCFTFQAASLEEWLQQWMRGDLYH